MFRHLVVLTCIQYVNTGKHCTSTNTWWTNSSIELQVMMLKGYYGLSPTIGNKYLQGISNYHTVLYRHFNHLLSFQVLRFYPVLMYQCRSSLSWDLMFQGDKRLHGTFYFYFQKASLQANMTELEHTVKGMVANVCVTGSAFVMWTVIAVQSHYTVTSQRIQGLTWLVSYAYGS